VRPPLPFVPGIEVCGRVVELGAGISGCRIDDRVIGMPALPHGGLAERALLPAEALFPAPEGLDDAEAAALTDAFQTAYVGLSRRAALRAGETVLVHAAAGGWARLPSRWPRLSGPASSASSAARPRSVPP
jgi:NADPH:quinone reductase